MFYLSTKKFFVNMHTDSKIILYPNFSVIELNTNGVRRGWNDSGGLDQRQYGFRKGHSTTDVVHRDRGTKWTQKKNWYSYIEHSKRLNSAPWEGIMKAMKEKKVPMYIRQIIDSYLDNRTLVINTEDQKKIVKLLSGVPQGSVLGPTLWNIIYDGLLRIRFPTGVSFLAFANDVALVAVGRDSIELGNLLSEAVDTTKIWLSNNGLKIAA
uniref:Putative RNA-directed DNA polymerase n=1 Tax=Sipha flava TaxID=143950 RepID=A0A2S2PV96_9HEMI